MSFDHAHQEQDAYERSNERADSLLDRVNERLKETIKEMHHGIEEEFGEGDEAMSDQARAVWEDLCWANRREARRRR